MESEQLGAIGLCVPNGLTGHNTGAVGIVHNGKLGTALRADFLGQGASHHVCAAAGFRRYLDFNLLGQFRLRAGDRHHHDSGKQHQSHQEPHRFLHRGNPPFFITVLRQFVGFPVSIVFLLRNPGIAVSVQEAYHRYLY